MIGRRRYSSPDLDSHPDAARLAHAHLAHLASLREARVHHRTITHELRSFYDAVAAEAVPSGFFGLFSENDTAAINGAEEQRSSHGVISEDI